MATSEGINTDMALAAIENAENEPEVTTEIVELEICPRCGYNATEQKINIPEKDREEYYRCLMALRPFKKIYSLWHGDLKITLSALDHKQTNNINQRLRIITSENPNEIMELSIKLKLLFQCRDIKTTEQHLEIEPIELTDETNIHTEFSRIFPLPEPMIRLLSKTFTEFEMLVDALNAEGFDENFYGGGGAA